MHKFLCLTPRGRRQLVKQIEKNQEQRALKAEQQAQEAQEMLDSLKQLQMEELRVWTAQARKGRVHSTVPSMWAWAHPN